MARHRGVRRRAARARGGDEDLATDVRDPGGPGARRARLHPLQYRRCMRIALFLACFNDTFFPSTGRAVVTLLERLGHDVEFPLQQTCCGQMHGNSGYEREGEALAKRLESIFAPYGVIVSP